MTYSLVDRDKAGIRVRYDDLPREQLVSLLMKRDAQRRLGLVWERDEIERDAALNSDFVVLSLDKAPEGSCGPNPWNNLIIEGDNFDALRWLRMTHASQVNVIYIDPPYNTGNKDWVYNDSYVSPEDRFRNSTWLEFMYQRLDLAGHLLRQDGVILVSINDENRAILELLMEEVFRGMRIGSFVWRTKDSAPDAGRNFSAVHEHVLVYGGPKFSFGGPKAEATDYSNPDEDPRGDWTTNPLTKAHTWVERPNTYYPIQNPKTGLFYPCSPDRVWAYASRDRVKEGQKLRAATMEAMIDDNRVWFPPETDEPFHYDSLKKLIAAIRDGDVPKDGKGHPLFREDLPDLRFWVGKRIARRRPSKKDFLSQRAEVSKPVSSWFMSAKEKAQESELRELVSEKQGAGTDRVKHLLGTKAFNFPKPVSLIRSLLEAAAPPGSVVLDFFAGSGTTAEAVLSLNAADGGERRFILVSSSEATADDPSRNLCRDVCAERVRRVIEGYSDIEGLGGGFAYLATERIDFDDLAYDMKPEHVWLAVQAMHGRPLRPFDPNQVLQISVNEDTAVIYCDRFTDAAETGLRGAINENAFVIVYTYTTGPVRDVLTGANNAEVRAVPDYLIKRFQG